MLVFVAGISVQAQDSWILYDDFNSEFMDVGKWTTSESRGTGVVLLETIREIHGNRLILGARAFGNITSYQNPPYPVPSQGTRSGDINAGFGVTQAHPFKGLKVSAKVNQAQASGCSNFNSTPTSARARLLGFFFNTTSPTPQQGDRTGDVLAQIRIQRNSNSTDKPQILEVLADVVKCKDSACSTPTTDSVISVYLGSINLGQWADIEIEWDKDNKRFNFKLNKEPTVNIGYPETWSDNYPPSSLWNALGVANRLAANCPADERAMGYVEVEFDNLFVKEFPNP